ncbi:MAG: hypothetical protein J0H49_13570 [Acidobacteria bacterium]|nr:hypothetical protein [Acidobacteriota bacterium]
MPNIELQEGVRAAFYLALVKPFAISSEVRSLLARRFDSASPSLRTELLWRLLDDPSLPLATHQRLFDFVKDHWDSFQGCLSYLGTPEEIVLSVLRRIAECPESKRWIYLCCLPQYAADPIAAKGILVLASASSDPFMAVVANSLLKRFWSDQMDNTSV